MLELDMPTKSAGCGVGGLVWTPRLFAMATAYKFQLLSLLLSVSCRLYPAPSLALSRLRLLSV
jgi:hypothetical protein